MVKNPPPNAGDVALIPGQGAGIPQAVERLCATASPNATTTEACTYSGAHVPRGKPADHSEDSEQRPPNTQQKWGTCSHLGLQISRLLLALMQESWVLNAQQLEAEPGLADPHP